MYNTDAHKFITYIKSELEACKTIEELKVVLAAILDDIVESIPKQQDPSEE